jgi:hypothetical protein
LKACDFFTFAFPHFIDLWEHTKVNYDWTEQEEQSCDMPALLAIKTMFSLIGKHLIGNPVAQEFDFSLCEDGVRYGLNSIAERFSKILSSLSAYISEEFKSDGTALNNVVLEMLMIFQIHIDCPFFGMIDNDDLLHSNMAGKSYAFLSS